MPAIQIRDLDTSTYELLKSEAKASGRSLNKQLEVIVKEHFATSSTQTAAKNKALYSPLEYSGTSSHQVNFDSAIEQRQAKRERLFQRMAQRSYPEFPAGLEPSALIREMRDAR